MARIRRYEFNSMNGGHKLRFHHYGLEVTNMEEAITFYENVLGFQTESRFSFMEEEIMFLTLENFRLELIPGQQGLTHLCFEVNNLFDVMKQLGELQKLEGPYELQNGWKTVFYEGPHQEIIEFLQVSNDK